MYRQHFRLNELPFTITPDTNFFFAQSSHQEALNTLIVAARSGEGFMKVVGEVGTGKTLLCRKFLDALEAENFVTAYIPNPYIGPNTLLLGVVDELGLTYQRRSTQHDVLKLLTNFLIETHASGRQVVLCLDEAQAMPVQTLEALRLLTNLETKRRKLLQVVLFGQPELDQKLNNRSIRQLKQRITFSCRLEPFSIDDVDYYIAHRLSIAGYRGPRVFTPPAIRKLWQASDGIPRLINVIAHKALMIAFGRGLRQVDADCVALAVNDTEATRGRHAMRRFLRRALSALTPLLLIAVLLPLTGILA